MEHPLVFVPIQYCKRFFLTFSCLTLFLFAIFRVLDEPLRTAAAPNGIVSFELAGDPLTARAITESWKQLSILLSSVAGQPNPDIVNTPYVFAAFVLGIDYLFMPTYALALAFGTLLATQKHGAAGLSSSQPWQSMVRSPRRCSMRSKTLRCCASCWAQLSPVIRRLPRTVQLSSSDCSFLGSWYV